MIETKFHFDVVFSTTSLLSTELLNILSNPIICWAFLFDDLLMMWLLFSLSNLESLELRENLIKYLPTSLAFLAKLKTLDLGSNLIDELVCNEQKQYSIDPRMIDIITKDGHELTQYVKIRNIERETSPEAVFYVDNLTTIIPL